MCTLIEVWALEGGVETEKTQSQFLEMEKSRTGWGDLYHALPLSCKASCEEGSLDPQSSCPFSL